MSHVKTYMARNIVGYINDIQDMMQTAFLPARTPDQRFIIFGTGRSGSTLFVHLLNNHPHIHCDGEIFNKKSFDELARLKRREKLCPQPTYGFKLLSYQLKDNRHIDDKRVFLHQLHKQGYKIIHIQRKNLLRQSLSYYKARSSQWHIQEPRATPSPSISVDADALIYLMRQRAILQKFEQYVLKDIPVLSVTYEMDLEDVSQHQALLESFCSFLGIPNQIESLNTKLQKITPKAISDFVRNADEIKRALTQSEFSTYANMVL